MHFKIAPWDWDSHQDKFSAPTTILGLFFEERPLFDYVFKNYLFKRRFDREQFEFFNLGSSPFIALKESLQSPSLFGPDRPYFIEEAQRLSPEQLELLLEHSQTNPPPIPHILLFHSKNKTLQSWSKGPHPLLWVQKVPFWDGRKLLQFLCRWEGRVFSPPILHYLCEEFGDGPMVLLDKFYQIHALFQGDKKIDQLPLIRDLLPPTHKNRFDLARALSSMDLDLWYRELLEAVNLGDDVRGLAVFLQGHLLKIMDPSYTQQKSRLSQYDRDLLGAHQKWRQQFSQLEEILLFLQNLERESKRGLECAQECVRLQWLGHHAQ